MVSVGTLAMIATLAFACLLGIVNLMDLDRSRPFFWVKSRESDPEGAGILLPDHKGSITKGAVVFCAHQMALIAKKIVH